MEDRRGRAALAVCGLVVAALATGAPLARGRAAEEDTALEPARLGGNWFTVANGDRVQAVLREDDTVWAATDGGGVVRWSVGDGTYRQFLAPQDGLPHNDVRALVRDRSGVLWAATAGGLARLAPGEVRWRAVAVTHPDLPSPSATVLVRTADGTLWVGFEQRWDPDAPGADGLGGHGAFVGGGLAGYDPVTARWGPVYRAALSTDADERVPGLPSENVTAVAVGADGTLWVGTRPYYRWREDACGRPQCPPELAAWGSDGGGLAATDDPALGFRHWNTRVAEGCEASTDQVTAVLSDSAGRVWTASRGRGLQAFLGGLGTRVCRPETGHRHFERTPGGLPGSEVWALAETPDGRLWLAVGDGDRGLGVAVLDHGGTLDVPAPGTAGDDVWVLHGLDGYTGRLDTVPVALDVTGGELVVGTVDTRTDDGGGVKVRTGDGAWRTLVTAADGPPSNQITAAAVDPAGGVLWLGTRHRGVARWDGARWTTFGAFDRAVLGASLLGEGARGTSQITLTIDAAAFAAAFPTAPRLARLAADAALYELEAAVSVAGGVRVGVRPALAHGFPAGTAVWTVRRGPAGDGVTAIAADGRGGVWVGARASVLRPARPGSGESRCETFPDCWYDGGLSVFDGTAWRTHTPAVGPGGALVRDIQALAADPRGRVWAGTGDASADEGSGVVVHDPADGSWRALARATEGDAFGGDSVTGVAVDRLTGHVWLATHHTRCAATDPGCGDNGRIGGGVSRWDGTRWTRWVKGAGSALTATGRDGNFTTVLFDPARARVWAGAWVEAPTGAHWISGVGVDAALSGCPRGCQDAAWDSRVFGDDGAVRALALDGTGRLWVGASRDGRGIVPHPGGVKLFGAEGWREVATDVWSREVTSLAADGDGMWVGTFDGGAARWRPGDLVPGAYLPVTRRAGASAGR